MKPGVWYDARILCRENKLLQRQLEGKQQELESLKHDQKLLTELLADLLTKQESTSDVEDRISCTICYEAPKNRAFTECGHTFCAKCVNKILNQKRPKTPTCPNCRHQVTHAIKIHI